MPDDTAAIWKLVAIAGYVLILIGIGVVASRRTRDVKDYFAGGKRMGFWAVAFSSRATGESAWLLLGLTGMGAAMGVKAFWIVFGEMLGVGLAWLWMSRRFKRLTDKYDSITVPDYLTDRFGKATFLRVIAVIALLVFVPIYVSAQIHACGNAFNGFLGWNYYAGAAAGFIVVLIYITSGGFVAVVWSDVFQGTLMVLGLVALPIVGYIALDGSLLSTLRELDPDLVTLSGKADFGGLATGEQATTIAGIIGFAAIGIGFLGSPQVFVRFISLRSENEIKRGAAVALTWTLLADSGAVLVGMVGRALLTGQELGDGSENVLPLMVDFLLPVVIGGIYIAVVLSAIMSTIDSLLVVASSAAVRDFYQKMLRPDLPNDRLIPLSRVLTAGLALVAFGIAMLVAWLTGGQPVFWFVIFGWSGIAATFCPTIIGSLFWSRMTAHGAAAGMIVGFLGVPFFKFVAPGIDKLGPYFEQLGELAPAFVVSGIAIVGVSLLTKKPDVDLRADLAEPKDTA